MTEPRRTAPERRPLDLGALALAPHEADALTARVLAALRGRVPAASPPTVLELIATRARGLGIAAAVAVAAAVVVALPRPVESAAASGGAGTSRVTSELWRAAWTGQSLEPRALFLAASRGR